MAKVITDELQTEIATKRDSTLQTGGFNYSAVITSDVQREVFARQLATVIAEAKRHVHSNTDRLCANAHALHKEACASRTGLLAPILKREAALNAAITEYDKQKQLYELDVIKKLQEQAKKERDRMLIDAAIEADEKGNEELAREAIAGVGADVEDLPLITGKPKSQYTTERIFVKWKNGKGKTKRKYMTRDKKAIDAVVKQYGHKATDIVGGIEVYEERKVYAKRQS